MSRMEAKREFRVIHCPKCGYEWIPVVENPKKCPRCQYRLDRPRRKMEGS